MLVVFFSNFIYNFLYNFATFAQSKVISTSSSIGKSVDIIQPNFIASQKKENTKKDEDELKKIKSEIQELKDLITQMTNNYENKINNLQKNIGELKAQITELKTYNSDLEKSLTQKVDFVEFAHILKMVRKVQPMLYELSDILSAFRNKTAEKSLLEIMKYFKSLESSLSIGSEVSGDFVKSVLTSDQGLSDIQDIPSDDISLDKVNNSPKDVSPPKPTNNINNAPKTAISAPKVSTTSAPKVNKAITPIAKAPINNNKNITPKVVPAKSIARSPIRSGKSLPVPGKSLPVPGKSIPVPSKSTSKIVKDTVNNNR